MSAVTEARSPGTTPQWLLRGELALCPCGCIGKRRKGSFVAKTLTGLAGVVGQAIFSEDVAGRKGLLQRIDPRVKLVTTLVLLVAVAFLRQLPLLALAYVGTVALAAGSGLSVGFFLKRVWLFVPIFTGIVVAPATLSIVTHGEVILPLWHWHGHVEGITAQGLHGAALIILRVATSVSLVVLLTLTTPWVRLLAGLRALGVPRMFVLTIGIAYRYLFLLLDSVDDMYTARKARTLGPETDVREGRRFVAAGAGALFGRAHQLSVEVHQAMTARGYVGNARTLERFQVAGVDLAWSVVVVAVAAALLLVDHGMGA
ncbi:cobalt ECF transporter T component CbiQ [Actinopolymorpha pittospori]|uniref:Cobalt ECF transporter T component CbiQ n=1 Tax=Actinopolymorpha pittospori TaxID=648752 RepID=A0A927MVM3_9ACTN|nr:cobalt ECF transporter T component CbiQ [Actinopolymorpha pittospori]